MNSDYLLSKLLTLAILTLGFFLLSPNEKKHIEQYTDPHTAVFIDAKAFPVLEGEDRENMLRYGQQCGEFVCYSPQDFVDAYNKFEEDLGFSFLSKYIFNDAEADHYIRILAESRGYQPRSFADESRLVSFEGHLTQPEVRDAYIAMRNEMLQEDIRLHFVSGYRSSTDQRRIFNGKLKNIDLHAVPSGNYDAEIDKALVVSAIPAYSKHHSGYAVDFACGNDYLVYEFVETECYLWMSKNNFENTKRYGFIPSYPYGVEKQGPNPEPWEFVWVGVERL